MSFKLDPANDANDAYVVIPTPSASDRQRLKL
jgi:hypothetical protein